MIGAEYSEKGICDFYEENNIPYVSEPCSNVHGKLFKVEVQNDKFTPWRAFLHLLLYTKFAYSSVFLNKVSSKLPQKNCVKSIT